MEKINPGESIGVQYSGITSNMYDKFYIAVFAEGGNGKPVTQKYPLTKSMGKSGDLVIKLPSNLLQTLNSTQAKCAVMLLSNTNNMNDFRLSVYFLLENREKWCASEKFNQNYAEVRDGKFYSSEGSINDYIEYLNNSCYAVGHNLITSSCSQAIFKATQ